MVNEESTNGGNDQEDFECNICFELAQDPIITLCGHLFCWPCLHQWLHNHSLSQDCPICKALVQVEKLVPIYGRGKNHTDPRSKHYPDRYIPSRSSGHMALRGGFTPIVSTRIGYLRIHFGFSNARLYGLTLGFYGGYHNSFRGQVRNNQLRMARGGGQQIDAAEILLLIFGICVIILLLW